jgi:hypothetical protein
MSPQASSDLARVTDLSAFGGRALTRKQENQPLKKIFVGGFLFHARFRPGFEKILGLLFLQITGSECRF